MLFEANFPHPAFVDQTVGTHGQGGFPDMLEMLLVVQFIQIALHGSVGRTGQLHCIGKNPVMGLFTAKFPCVVGLGIFEQHIPFPEAECSRGPGQPQQQLIFRLVAAGGLPQHFDVKGKIALIVCGVLVHNGFQRSNHIHIFKFLHGLYLQFLCLFPWRRLLALLLFRSVQLCPDGRLFRLGCAGLFGFRCLFLGLDCGGKVRQ